MRPYLIAMLLAVPLSATADPPPATQGKFTIDLRLRSEFVDDDAFAASAEATTLRARLGYRTAVHSGWSAVVDIEGTGHLFDEDFNSTANGHTGFPTVVDPDNFELNQAYLNYAPSDRSRVTFGRQRLVYDNQRFFGNVGWRQNEQTFDALDAQHRTASGWTFRYSYLDRVQRVFGNDHPLRSQARWDLDAHLLQASHAIGAGQFSAYAHFIDNRTLPLNSHQNYGLRYTARRDAPEGVGWMFAAEAAWQQDYDDAPANRDASYQWLEGGLIHRGNTWRLGWERLGGDGTYAFQTPFATLHAFNGWADKFLTTPANGLQDVYLGWSRKFGAVTAAVVWHDYRSDHASLHYGSELDASLAWAFRPGWTATFKLADYNADDLFRDTQKVWLQLDYVY